MGLVVSVNPSRINRLDLFESAGIEVVQGKVATEEDMIELMKGVDLPTSDGELPQAESRESIRRWCRLHRSGSGYRVRDFGV